MNKSKKIQKIIIVKKYTLICVKLKIFELKTNIKISTINK